MIRAIGLCILEIYILYMILCSLRSLLLVRIRNLGTALGKISHYNPVAALFQCTSWSLFMTCINYCNHLCKEKKNQIKF